jgi:pyruvate dehydrogenase E2 component (dihydrolipoamide acetyltransferase)
MAKNNVVMPQMGESITTGTITKWHKNPGDMVEIDEILLEISTDKVESEIPSLVKGRMETLLYPEGATVDVGLVIATIEDDLSAAPSAPAKVAAPAAPPVSSVMTKVSPEPVAQVTQVTKAAESSHQDQHRFYTPLVKSMAKAHGVDLNDLKHLEGSGAGSRVNKNDFLNYLDQGSKQNSTSTSSPAPVQAQAQAPIPKSTPVAAMNDGRVEIIPMDNMRKAIAKNMLNSKMTSPHVNSISEVDLSHLVRFREGFKEEFKRQEGFNLTYTPFILRAIILALKDHPRVNASILNNDTIVIKKFINLGCAVAVPGNGLLVPVIHDADNLSMTGLCRKLNDLANLARNKKLTMDQLEGGTFTFTNVGSFGTLMATPVILQPQLGIYASGVIQKRPVVISTPEGDSLSIRHMMYGTHTYDHRLVDGEMGGRFLESVHEHLRKMDPKALF